MFDLVLLNIVQSSLKQDILK